MFEVIGAIAFPAFYAALVGVLRGDHRAAHFGWDELQRVAVHRILQPGSVGAFPREGKQHPLVGARVFFEATLQQPGDRAFGRADGTVQQ